MKGRSRFSDSFQEGPPEIGSGLGRKRIEVRPGAGR